MIFRQDIKKLYVRAVFLFGSFVTLLVYGLFKNVEFGLEDIVFIAGMILFPVFWCLSYYWYFFELTDTNLVKRIFGKVKSIPIKDITELSYVDNPARPLVYINFTTSSGREDYIEFTTGVWSPHTLYSLNDALQSKNPNIQIKFDEKTRKSFEQDKDYHSNHPQTAILWIGLGLKQLAWGVSLSILLIALYKYL